MNTQQQVVPLDQQSASGPKTKWGKAVSGGVYGYQVLPDVLVRNQARLGLTSTDMVVLVNILMHWWERDPNQMPHPRPSWIAQRAGVSARTVQRSIDRMCRRGLLQLMPAERRREGPSVRRFNVSGLVQRLQLLAQQPVPFEGDVAQSG